MRKIWVIAVLSAVVIYGFELGLGLFFRDALDHWIEARRVLAVEKRLSLTPLPQTHDAPKTRYFARGADGLLALTGKSHNQNYYGMGSYLSDRYGFPNPDQVWDQPAAAAVLGDSLVHGGGVTPEQSLGEQLRPAFSPMLNLAMGGSSSLRALTALTESRGIPKVPEI